MVGALEYVGYAERLERFLHEPTIGRIRHVGNERLAVLARDMNAWIGVGSQGAGEEILVLANVLDCERVGAGRVADHLERVTHRQSRSPPAIR